MTNISFESLKGKVVEKISVSDNDDEQKVSSREGVLPKRREFCR